jgi:hypothetical protein
LRSTAAIFACDRWFARRGLQALLSRFGCLAISLSEPFEDGLALLRVA